MAGMHARTKMHGGVEDVSVITVCRNAAATIGRTVDSVLSQSLEPMEYILIDGVSTDGTLDILRAYGNRITTIVSEPDNGISDAFNKGILRARGGSIKLLNADDWLETDTLEKSVHALERHPDAGFVFGDISEHPEQGGAPSRIAGDPKYTQWIRRVMGPLNHPSVLVRREVYEKYGVFDDRWTVAMDYDWFLRVHLKGVSGVYDPEILVHMTAGGKATSERLSAFKDVRDISIAHGYPKLLAYAYYLARLGKHGLLRAAGGR